jgi:predicted permease
LLRRALPRDVREGIVGDLDERFAADTAGLGAAAARRLYRRKAASLSGRFLMERLRDAIVSIARLRISALDLRLGFRMLVRYPVLTVIGTAALAFAIAIGATVFGLVSLMLWPSLPLPDGDRIVSVRMHDDAANTFEDRASADFLRWRGAVSSLEDLGAGRLLSRNLTMADEAVEPVKVAEVTPSTFRTGRVAPIMGRALNDEDAAPVAPPVLVLGEWLWRTKFASDPAIVGRSVMLGQTPTAVIGVMPETFKFPSTAEVWVPLRIAGTEAPRAGASIRVWARLKAGVTLDAANAELRALGARASADWPATHAKLRPEVRPFAWAAMELGPTNRTLVAALNLPIALLLLLISANVALLMFARAATREPEIIVRTALGATRGRVIMQFFSEALLLTGLALAVGLALANNGIRWVIATLAVSANDGEPLPFWFYQPLPPLSIAYAFGLAILAAFVTGVMPALKVTRALSPRLRQSSAGGGGLKFGGMWTVVIVAQIAVTVMFPAVTFFVQRDAWQIQHREIGVPPAQILSARLSRDRDLPPARFAEAVKRVRSGMASVPGVGRVTVGDKLPLMWSGHYEIQLDEGGAAAHEDELPDGYRISTAAVDPDFFAAFDATPLAGRLFAPSDYVGTPRVVIVNQPFVDRVLGGRSPIGRRIRYTAVDEAAGQRPPFAQDQPWLEIVGLVRDIGMAGELDPKLAGAYIPLDLTSTAGVYVAARVRPGADLKAASQALRKLGAEADALLRITDVRTLDHVNDSELRQIDFGTRLGGALSLATLILSLSGIYAVMSFAVSRRTREIGIRVALGSGRSRVVLSILRRPLLQVAAGVAAGAVLVLLLSGQTVASLRYALALFGYVLVVFGVCLLACVVPVRRALKVDPIAALRAD